MKQSIVALLLVVALAAPSLHAAPTLVTFTVNSVLDQIDDDTNDGVCHTAANTCTLRAAVMQANAISGAGAEIILPAGVYRLTRPSAGANGADVGDLNLTTPAPASVGAVITISGAGAASTIIDANQLDRVFRVHASRWAAISGVTIRNGYISFISLGGGIFNEGLLTISNSTISGNEIGFEGGGIYNDSTGLLTISNSTISGNETGFDGSGIANRGTLNVNASTISGNTANSKGGILNKGNMFLTNSTIALNDANGDGGGIYNSGTSNVYNTTIVFNRADADHNNFGSVGGVYNAPGGTFNLRNTLLAGNLGFHPLFYEDCSGTINSYSRNLLGDTYGCTVNTVTGSWGYLNLFSALGPLRDNGGPTWTVALLPGSNAIDGSDPNLADGCVDQHSVPLNSDQRGATRVLDGNNDGIARCDIGAFEYRPPLYLPLILR